MMGLELNSLAGIACELYCSMARALGSKQRYFEFESYHWHSHCKFLRWYQEFLCPVEPSVLLAWEVSHSSEMINI